MTASGVRLAGLAVASTLASAAILGGSITGLLWGVVALAAYGWRAVIGWPKQQPPITRIGRALEALFGLAVACWLASDTWRVFGFSDRVGSVAPGPEVLANLGTIALIGSILGVVYLRGRPRTETWLDSLSFVVALSAPAYLAFLAPSAADPELLSAVRIWTALTLVTMFFGGMYIMSGGIWNVPAVLLALAVVGSVAAAVTLRLADPASVLDIPRFVPAYVIAPFVALHPQIGMVSVRGGRPSGVGLEARAWMLVGALALPLATLGWCFVQAQPVPLAAIVGPLAVMASIVCVRAALLARSGFPDWPVPLTISLAALVVAGVAVSVVLRSESARAAQNTAAELAEQLPQAKQLDGLLLRSISAETGESQRAHREWSQIVGTLARSEHAPEPELNSYLLQADRLMQAAQLDAGTAPEREIDAMARADAQLVGALSRGIDERRAVAEKKARSVRLFTVVMLAAALLAVATLLLVYTRGRNRLELRYQRTHDPLTGLPNRAALEHELRQEPRVPATDPRRTLVLLDLDDFKSINDSFGLEAGDRVIETVARRLQSTTLGDHLLARTDGDAFAILVPGGQDPLATAHHALATLAAPITLGDRSYAIRASVGIAEVDESDDHRHSSAIRDAEAAMYEAKRTPGINVQVFEADMHQRLRDRIQLASDLREAIDTDGLHLAYQPIVNLDSGKVSGYEALVRWSHPTRGFLSPADFIPLAEETGLIVDLGAWVLNTATAQLVTWQGRWNDDRYVSVNVAAAQLASNALREQVRDALERSGLPPERLLLEVTESSLIDDVDASVEQMQQVRTLGARFALDDFGTGYSSLSYLRRFPVDVLKVDKSFIDDLNEADGASLVRAIINMAVSLRLSIVAEGIEESHQAALLQQLGCDLGQGYHFSRPLPAGEVAEHRRTFEIPASTNLRVWG